MMNGEPKKRGATASATAVEAKHQCLNIQVAPSNCPNNRALGSNRRERDRRRRLETSDAMVGTSSSIRSTWLLKPDVDEFFRLSQNAPMRLELRLENYAGIFPNF
jgi:hypothetical protein